MKKADTQIKTLRTRIYFLKPVYFNHNTYAQCVNPCTNSRRIELELTAPNGKE